MPIEFHPNQSDYSGLTKIVNDGMLDVRLLVETLPKGFDTNGLPLDELKGRGYPADVRGRWAIYIRLVPKDGYVALLTIPRTSSVVAGSPSPQIVRMINKEVFEKKPLRGVVESKSNFYSGTLHYLPPDPKPATAL